MGALNRLSVAKIKSLPPGKYNDGGGLWLWKRPNGAGQWFLRVTVHGRRREMGLGGVHWVTLAEARDEADKWRRLAKRGIDPVKERDRERREAARNSHMLADVALEAFEARKADLKGEGKAGRWLSPLELHVLPKLGRVPVAEIDQRDIRDTLSPIWREKAETGRKALSRLGIVMKYAAAMGLDVDLQAVDKAKALLGSNRGEIRHMPAMPWQDVPAFYATLTDEPLLTKLALRFLILTATRSSEVRFLNVSEIDGNLWTIPAERMKAGVEHRVPLSDEALRVIEEAAIWQRDGFVFAGPRKGVISDASMSRFMSRHGEEARPHGFRSSFRDWCAEETDAPREVAETALAHVNGNTVERAYRRTDYLEARRDLMERWAAHVTGEAS